MVGGDPIDPGDDVGHRAFALATQHPHGDELHRLGHAGRRAADGAGDVRAMAVAVVGCTAVDRVEPTHRPTTEVVVREPDAGVDHVCRHAGTVARRRVSTVERQ